MHHRPLVTILLIATLSAALVSCASKEERLVDGTVAVLSGAVKVLEKHKETPAEGVKALDAYFADKADKIAKLQALADELQGSLSDHEKEALQGQLEQAIKSAQKRLDKVADAYAETPEAMKALEGLVAPK